ncbi:hypothetical protein ACFSSC_09450 [Corynebacterium mendelii]|uniref:Uncharacterized protein n=1 Tax=Corynebacterium mendelii TaxID=2765362 RepID=A0A939IYK2_9CORY|nr:hypothetical protein [Corynebacterium mendelii]
MPAAPVVITKWGLVELGHMSSTRATCGSTHTRGLRDFLAEGHVAVNASATTISLANSCHGFAFTISSRWNPAAPPPPKNILFKGWFGKYARYRLA